MAENASRQPEPLVYSPLVLQRSSEAHDAYQTQANPPLLRAAVLGSPARSAVRLVDDERVKKTGTVLVMATGADWYRYLITKPTGRAGRNTQCLPM